LPAIVKMSLLSETGLEPHRLKDLADVQELIKFRNLPKDFADRLHPYVRAKFQELYEAVEQSEID